MKLTSKQMKWLNSRGGRNHNDVSKDRIGLYIFMSDPHSRDIKIYLPDQELNNK
jgi:hypothetical protein